MSTAPVAILDVLNSLLEAELNSVFRFMGEGSPYLSKATVEVRRPLQEMVDANNRNAAELAAMIQALGGTPAPRSLRPEEQYLGYLSLKFLLPKLVDEKALMLRRYDNALKALDKSAPPREVVEMLKRQDAECRRYLDLLTRVAADVVAAAKRGAHA